MCLRFEDLVEPQKSKVEQNANKFFQLENLFYKKQNEIFHLEKEYEHILEGIKVKRGNLKHEIFLNSKGESVPATTIQGSISDEDPNPEDEIFLKNLLMEELEARRSKYQKATKQIIMEKKLLNSNLKRKQELLRQIQELKQPKRLETEDKCNSDDNSPSRLTLSTLPSWKVEDSKEDKVLVRMTDNLDKNISTLHFLKNELEEAKRRKLKFEKDLYAHSNYLSDKFSLIFKLEIQLEKIKYKGQNKLNLYRDDECLL